MEFIEEYRGFIIEYMKYRGDYRVYRPEKEYQTIAYVDTVEEAKAGIDEYAQKQSR